MGLYDTVLIGRYPNGVQTKAFGQHLEQFGVGDTVPFDGLVGDDGSRAAIPGLANEGGVISRVWIVLDRAGGVGAGWVVADVVDTVPDGVPVVP